jgi:NAD(P)H-hydrate epimerase
MENAGRGTAELLLALGIHGRVTICCGKGNNGGDGFVIARHLDNHDVPVRILLFARPEELTGDAATNYWIAVRSGLPLEVHATEPLDETRLRLEFGTSEWVVDALFGTGLTGPLRSPYDRVIANLNASPAHVLAVDIPSGLDCDTGEPLGPTVRAHHTATMVAEKKGFLNPAASEWTGRVHVVDIGAPRKCVHGIGEPGGAGRTGCTRGGSSWGSRGG